MRIPNPAATGLFLLLLLAVGGCASEPQLVGYRRAEGDFWRGFLADSKNTLPERVLKHRNIAPFVVNGTLVAPQLPENPTARQITDYGKFQPVLYGFVGYNNEYHDIFVKYTDPWIGEDGISVAAPAKKADICAIQRSLMPEEVTRPFPRPDCLPKWAIASPPTLLEPPSTQAIP